jgi:hypothetical protein
MTTPTTPQTVHHLFTFYLSPAHIDKPATATIDSADIRAVFNDKAGKELPALVIHFRDARRSLKCNKTQVESIWEIAGTDDHTKWAGTRITLSKEPTKRGGKFTIKISKPAE